MRTRETPLLGGSGPIAGVAAPSLLQDGLAAAARADWDGAVSCFASLVADLDPLRAGEAWGTSAAWYAAVLLRRATPGDADEAARVIGQAAARSLAADCGTVPATHGSRCGLTTALTSRESEVLSHIAAGQTNSQIAADLSISIHTVTRHVTHIFEKLAVPNRAAAAVHGREFGRSGAAVNPA